MTQISYKKKYKIRQRKLTNKRLFLCFHLAMLKEHSCFKTSTLEIILHKSKEQLPANSY